MFTHDNLRYQYDGASDDASDPNTLAMREGDEVILLERDVGDGWTRVRHSRTVIIFVYNIICACFDHEIPLESGRIRTVDVH